MLPMIQRIQQTQEVDGDTWPKWFNSPVNFYEGTLSDIRRYVPSFERRSFCLARPDDKLSRLNERLDMIVRLPLGEDSTFIPVGVVSKNYALVQHTDILDVAARALGGAKIALDAVKAEIEITEYGERMALSLYLPDKYSFDPGDGYPMALRLECFNSVDGSTRFRALMGWFRLVCRNGLIIRVTRSDVRRRHVGDLRLKDVGEILASGLRESETEKKNFERWRKTVIRLDRLATWVNRDLREEWGFKAAARAFHIASCGYDAVVLRQYKTNTPTTIPMQKTKLVPGAPEQCRNLFGLSQILAWLAQERRDVQEQLEWRERIPKLMAPLLN
jgi:hypothetical protein